MPILRIKYALAVLAFAACAAASAQGTFNIASSPGFPQNHFRHVIVHDDTIVGLGMAFSDSIEWRQGLIVAKYDSSGALLASAFLSDTLGGRLAVDRQWGKIAKASGGGYVLTAATVERKDAILFKLDASLQEEFRHEYADTVNLSNFRYQAPIEIEDGYILYGAIQRPNFRNDPFARRVDRQGNTVWHRYYGSSSFSETYLDAALLGDSALVAGGVRIVQNELAYTFIDRISLEDGSLLHSWQSSLNPDIGWFRKLAPLEDGGLMVYGSRLVEIVFDTWIVEPTLSRLGPDFQVQWRLTCGPARSINSLSNFDRIAPAADGNFLGAGSEIVNIGGVSHRAGWLLKFTPEGDTLWSRYYLPPLDAGEGDIINSWFGGFGELSSGNIVAGGFAQMGAGLYGWLLKTDAQGCLEGEPCELPTSAGEAPAAPGLAGLRAFPNPTSGHLSVELPEGYPAAAARLYSLHGRLAFQQRLAGGLNELYLPLPPGLYILEVELPGGGRHREKIVLAR
jgi:hypothetical protein